MSIAQQDSQEVIHRPVQPAHQEQPQGQAVCDKGHTGVAGKPVGQANMRILCILSVYSLSMHRESAWVCPQGCV